MGDISAHFSMKEFRCHNDTDVPDDLMLNLLKLVNALETLRNLFFDNRPITIVSGYRTLEYNKGVGGAEKSRHLKAEAADIQVKDMSPETVHSRIEEAISSGKIPEGGLGLYKIWVHYDVRGYKARWGQE